MSPWSHYDWHQPRSLAHEYWTDAGCINHLLCSLVRQRPRLQNRRSLTRDLFHVQNPSRSEFIWQEVSPALIIITAYVEVRQRSTLQISFFFCPGEENLTAFFLFPLFLCPLFLFPLKVITLSSLLWASWTDPGVVPRATRAEGEHLTYTPEVPAGGTLPARQRTYIVSVEAVIFHDSFSAL